MIKWFKEWYERFRMNDFERYVSGASDLYDLERRQRDLFSGRVKFY